MLGCPRSLALFPPQWLMVPDLHLEMPGTRLSLGLPKQQLSHPEGFGSERPQEIIFEDSPHRPSGLPILAHGKRLKKTQSNSGICKDGSKSCICGLDLLDIFQMLLDLAVPTSCRITPGHHLAITSDRSEGSGGGLDVLNGVKLSLDATTWAGEGMSLAALAW